MMLVRTLVALGLLLGLTKTEDASPLSSANNSTLTVTEELQTHGIKCREPNDEIAADERLHRKFLLFGGEGGGLGNFLIFFPSAYYLAALTGREIIIIDNSLLGEVCKVVLCGYPFLSTMTEAYPEYFDDEAMKRVKGVKVIQFRDYFEKWPKDTMELKDAPLIRADGYKYGSEWWLGLKHAESCMQHITGCEVSDDIACGDRHALQKLLLGPFRSKFTTEEESRILGVPNHVKHGILSLKHSLSPRFEVAVHLRTQFKHFEWLVGPKDDKWKDAEDELNNWLTSKDGDKGIAIFRAMEKKLLEVLGDELQIRYGGPVEVNKASSGPLAAEDRRQQATSAAVHAPPAPAAPAVARPTASPSIPSTSPAPTLAPSPVVAKTASGGVTGSLWEMIWNDPTSVKRRQTVKPEPVDTPSPPLPLTSASGAALDYKKLYEETQQKIDKMDYKKLYEMTKSKIKELQMELGEAPTSSSSSDSSGYNQGRDLGSGKKLIVPLSTTTEKKETLASSFITHSTSSLSPSSPSPSEKFEELNFAEKPYTSRLRMRRKLISHTHQKPDANILYVYVGSDNSVVKERFCRYIESSNYTFTINSGNVSGVSFPVVLKLEVMRIVNEGGYIAHGKNIKNLKETTNNTGVVDLALDWYAISLANHILSWRRDTHLISTFAQSAQRLSGNTESTSKNKIENEGGTRNTHYHGIGHGRGSRGHNMYFGRNNPFLPQWREYW